MIKECYKGPDFWVAIIRSDDPTQFYRIIEQGEDDFPDCFKDWYPEINTLRIECGKDEPPSGYILISKPEN